jgi:chromosome segregation protein
MRLKSIKLAGFKSFVDPTTVKFPSNLCAVVGPNGCGKSNIIDAVRWVMGESSAKNLRGESMSDVIFNGSSARKPVGQATIELIFDNSDGSLVGEYAGYSEVAIRRTVTRDGMSQYYLNGTKCRRRDITDIFLGTGLGPRSYAIIEQGMISRLIEAKPEELRVYIEEAAGISKYKDRRRDTENRIKRTRENLDRLTDLRDELERQLQHLKRQANAAERYGVLKKEERLTRAQLNAIQWQGLDEQAQQEQSGIREMEVKLESEMATRQHYETEIEKHRHTHMEMSDRLNEIQARYYGLGSEIARAEQSIQHQQERNQQLLADLSSVSRDYQETQQHIAQDEKNLQQWQQEIESITPQLEELKGAEEGSTAALAVAEEAMHEWQRQWEQFNHEASEPRQQAEVQQSRIQHIEKNLVRLRERLDKLATDQRNLQIDPKQQEVETLRKQMQVQTDRNEEKQRESDRLLMQIDARREEMQSVSAELDEARNSLQKMRGRQASLEALQQAALGESSEAVTGWLAQNRLDQNQRLAESLQVEPGWETAVETVLGDYLQAVCVDDIDAIADSLGSLDQGRISFWSADKDAGSAVPAGGNRLTDKIGNGDSLKGLLGNIRVAETLADAMAIRGSLSVHESVITREGIWLGSNWLRVARDEDANAGVIRRRLELSALETEIQQSENREQDLAAKLEQVRAGLRNSEVQRDSLQKDLKEQAEEHAELRSRISAQLASIEQMAARKEDNTAELADGKEQICQEEEHLKQARSLLQQALESMADDESRREQLLQERDNTRKALDDARHKARHDKDTTHQLAIRHQSLSTQIESARQSVERSRNQFRQLDERRGQLKLSLDESEEPLHGIQADLEKLLERRVGLEQELTAARQKVQSIEHHLREAESKQAEVNQQVEKVRQRLEQARIQAQTIQVQRQALEQKLAEGQYDLGQLLEELPDDADEARWQEQLEKLANRIARLGPINLAAIDEYDAQSERKHYLDAQNEDLVEALTTLENAIRKIDRETRSRFKETFDQVNNGLQELFPKVFGGGNAYLEMTGDDLLDTGIAIMARPPGKRNSTIHLLSGGEKALTAIALVFSIFRLNPAPFCMLDEVDAPLDDANVLRYARMVEEMSQHVQFIFITHNKITMEMAQQLMGVTMHEPGVSRLVSVDVEEAAEMAEAS